MIDNQLYKQHQDIRTGSSEVQYIVRLTNTRYYGCCMRFHCRNQNATRLSRLYLSSDLLLNSPDYSSDQTLHFSKTDFLYHLRFLNYRLFKIQCFSPFSVIALFLHHAFPLRTFPHMIHFCFGNISGYKSRCTFHSLAIILSESVF